MMSDSDRSRSDTTAQSDDERSRMRAIRYYLLLSTVQMLSGLTEFVCASMAIHYYEKTGFPYFSGSFAIGCTLLMSSMLAFRVFNKGPLYSTCEDTRREVVCAINWHRGLSLFMFFTHVIGLAIIWMYGMCITDKRECSDETLVKTNRILAYVSFAVGCIGFGTSVVGVLALKKFGKAFGIPNHGRRVRRHNRRHLALSGLQRHNGETPIQLGVASGCQGFTNDAFVHELVPPPYTPCDTQISVLHNNDLNLRYNQVPLHCAPPKYSVIVPTDFPNDAPPPYQELAVTHFAQESTNL